MSKYRSLNEEGDQSQTPGLSTGKRVILPSYYVRSHGFLDQFYYDGMDTCRIYFTGIFLEILIEFYGFATNGIMCFFHAVL